MQIIKTSSEDILASFFENMQSFDQKRAQRQRSKVTFVPEFIMRWARENHEFAQKLLKTAGKEDVVKLFSGTRLTDDIASFRSARVGEFADTARTAIKTAPTATAKMFESGADGLRSLMVEIEQNVAKAHGPHNAMPLTEPEIARIVDDTIQQSTHVTAAGKADPDMVLKLISEPSAARMAGDATIISGRLAQQAADDAEAAMKTFRDASGSMLSNNKVFHLNADNLTDAMKAKYAESGYVDGAKNVWDPAAQRFVAHDAALHGPWSKGSLIAKPAAQLPVVRPPAEVVPVRPTTTPRTTTPRTQVLDQTGRILSDTDGPSISRAAGGGNFNYHIAYIQVLRQSGVDPSVIRTLEQAVLNNAETLRGLRQSTNTMQESMGNLIGRSVSESEAKMTGFMRQVSDQVDDFLPQMEKQSEAFKALEGRLGALESTVGANRAESAAAITKLQEEQAKLAQEMTAAAARGDSAALETLGKQVTKNSEDIAELRRGTSAGPTPPSGAQRPGDTLGPGAGKMADASDDAARQFAEAGAKNIEDTKAGLKRQFPNLTDAQIDEILRRSAQSSGLGAKLKTMFKYVTVGTVAYYAFGALMTALGLYAGYKAYQGLSSWWNSGSQTPGATGPGGGGPGGGGPGGGGAGGGGHSVTLPDGRQTTIERLHRQGDWTSINSVLNSERPGAGSPLLEAVRRAYGKSYAVPLQTPFDGEGQQLNYVFINRTPGARGPIGPDGLYRQDLLQVVRRAVDDPKRGGRVYEHALGNTGPQANAQIGLNEAFEDTLGLGLYEEGWFGGTGWLSPGQSRTRKYISGKGMGRGSGYAGRESRDMSRAERRQRRRTADLESILNDIKKFSEEEPSEKRINEIRQLAGFALNSTNNYSESEAFTKKADKFSRSYYKDAVKGLSDGDEFQKSYYTGLGRLYDKKPKRRKADYDSLYDVSDETGEDLIHAAHPEAIVVAEGRGRGGLVENGLEQKRQTHGVALSTPTGNYRGNYV